MHFSWGQELSNIRSASLVALAGLIIGVGVASPGADAAVYSNPTPITITDNAPATAYPAAIGVADKSGLTIAKVRATFNGFAHQFPNDVDALLVGPTGQRAMLMSDICDGISITGKTFTFDDAAPTLLSSGACSSGTFKPTNADNADVFPGIPTPYPAALSGFIGSLANGAWSLYVHDDAAGASGSIAGGWNLEVLPFVSCNGRFATEAALVGTGESNRINGTPGPDVILGLGGRDRIFGLGGNDRICGGLGDDIVSGGGGRDRLLGQKGDDILRGKGGKDVCRGGANDDKTTGCEGGKA